MDDQESRHKALSRREWLRRAGKLAYTAPAITVLPLVPVEVAAFSPPPPPPADSEALRDFEHSLLEQERTPAGPDPLEMFSGDGGDDRD